MRMLIPLLLLAGCAAGAEPSSAGNEDELARLLKGRVAGEPERCISTRPSEGLRAIDERTLVYGTIGTIYVNRLEHACPSVEPLNTLIVEVHGGQLCRGDHVRGLEPGTTIPGPVCLLGDFVPYKPVK